MKRLRLLSLILGLSISSGCMVIDELDKAAAMMPNAKKTKADAEAEAAASAGSATEKVNALLDRSKQWWDSATSLSPTGLKTSIVTCRLGDRMRFMSKDDCLSQGGMPGSAAG